MSVVNDMPTKKQITKHFEFDDVTGDKDTPREKLQLGIPVDIIGTGAVVSRRAIVDTGFTHFAVVPTKILSLCEMPFTGHKVPSLIPGGVVVEQMVYTGKLKFFSRTVEGLIIGDDTGNDITVGIKFLQTLGATVNIQAAGNKFSLSYWD